MVTEPKARFLRYVSSLEDVLHLNQKPWPYTSFGFFFRIGTLNPKP